MSEDLDFSFLEKISPEVEEALSPGMKRILAQARRLREAEE